MPQPVQWLEKVEIMDLLCLIENGYRIKVAETELETYAVDTPEDLAKLKM